MKKKRVFRTIWKLETVIQHNYCDRDMKKEVSSVHQVNYSEVVKGKEFLFDIQLAFVVYFIVGLFNSTLTAKEHC